MIVGTNAYRINGTAEHQFLNNNLNYNKKNQFCMLI